MYIKRHIEQRIINHISISNEVLFLYGARQVGKSTLITKILDDLDKKTIQINGEELKYQQVFSSQDLQQMLDVVSGYELLFIDEAQNIQNIGINIKLLHDANKKLKIILSGSSSFELANKIKEPLTGRTQTMLLYPLSFSELKNILNPFELKAYVSDYLIFGGYPKLYSLDNKTNKISALNEMASSYLYKDVLMFGNLRNSKMLFSLLKLLAFQIGSTVSIHELSKTLRTSSETVERYIDLLEKAFVIYRLTGFSGNLRKEISKMDKIYFYDIGIRNSIINNFSDLNDRNDVGQLWENFLITERLKKIEYNEMSRRSYFWRTYSGSELDYIEEFDDELDGYEFKWGNKNKKRPISWTNNYAKASYKLINQNNFLEFVT